MISVCPSSEIICPQIVADNEWLRWLRFALKMPIFSHNKKKFNNKVVSYYSQKSRLTRHESFSKKNSTSWKFRERAYFKIEKVPMLPTPFFLRNISILLSTSFPKYNAEVNDNLVFAIKPFCVTKIHTFVNKKVYRSRWFLCRCHRNPLRCFFFCFIFGKRFLQGFYVWSIIYAG